MKLEPIYKSPAISLYRLANKNNIACYLASTPETRKICNDPFIYGVNYTEKLKKAVTKTLRALKNKHCCLLSSEENAVIFNILRGGLNYGLREALYRAFGWSRQHSAFISSQRIKDKKHGWHITENRYQKIYMPDDAHIVLGDVVATGTSLEHALLKLVDIARAKNKTIASLTFFTIGSEYAEKIIAKVDKKCRRYFPNYLGSSVIYFEGRFGMVEEKKIFPRPLQIFFSGTDLLRSPAILTPEFIHSQKESISYALERCVIYDAGSRAFHIKGYLKDVHSYWQQVAQLAKAGQKLDAYLAERFPEDIRLTNKKWRLKFSSPKQLLLIAKKQLRKK
ncbi:MAG: phosphoribosyltransferase [Patescibacteria group bacterium]